MKTRMEHLRELQADRDFARSLDQASDFVPPGFRLLTTVRNELGAKELRTRLSAGRLKAHLWSRDGNIEPCSKSFWASEWAEATIQAGTYTKFRLLVPEEGGGTEVPTDKLAHDTTYLSPYMQRMIEASRVFDLGSPKGRRLKKKTLVAWFLEQGLPDGSAISRNIADNMATLCRDPSAMRGGNKR